MNQNNQPWVPRLFEDEIQLIQPEFDLVSERYSSAPNTLAGNLINEKLDPDNENEVNDSNEIPEYFPDCSDDDDNILRERETILMIRNLGMESCANAHFDSNKTLPCHQTKEKAIYQGNLPILLSEEYFKLKPSTSVVEETNMNESTSESGCNTKTTTCDSLPLRSHKNSSANTSSSDTSYYLSTTDSSSYSSSISLTSSFSSNSTDYSQLDKVLGIKRHNKKLPIKTLEEKYLDDFPNLEISKMKKNKIKK